MKADTFLPPSLSPGLLSEFGVEEESTIQLLMDINVRRGRSEAGNDRRKRATVATLRCILKRMSDNHPLFLSFHSSLPVDFVYPLSLSYGIGWMNSPSSLYLPHLILPPFLVFHMAWHI